MVPHVKHGLGGGIENRPGRGKGFRPAGRHHAEPALCRLDRPAGDRRIEIMDAGSGASRLGIHGEFRGNRGA